MKEEPSKTPETKPEETKKLPWKRIALIGAPALAVLLAAVILLPKAGGEKAAPAEETPAVAVTVEPVSIPGEEVETPAEPEAEAEPAAVQLLAEVTESDLLVKVCDADGNLIRGVRFQICLTYPDGSDHVFQTDTEGRLYRIGVGRGEYRISMLPMQGYVDPEPITANVSAEAAAVNATEGVVNASQLPANETTPANAGGAAQPADSITTPTGEDIGGTGNGTVTSEDDVVIIDDEGGGTTGGGDSGTVTGGGEGDDMVIIGTGSEAGPGMVVTTIAPILDASGNQTYTYSYSTGASGMLLLASTGEESDVYPIEENGVLRYGIRRTTTYFRSDENGVTQVDAIPEVPEEGVSYYAEDSAEYVPLFNADNTPVGEYMITASPVVHADSFVVGWQDEDGRSYYYDRQGSRVTGLKEIDGKLYYFDASGAKAAFLGVDVSFFNGAVDWAAVRSMGIDFVIVRLGGRGYSSGVLFEDDYYASYLQGARAAGMKIGAYFYSSAADADEAVQEANLAVALLGGTALDLPLYVDMEHSPGYPNGRADRLSAQARTEIAQAFCETVAAAGYRPGVYASQNYFYESINYAALSSYSIWMASYTSDVAMPSFRHSYNIWQCTSTAAVRGMTGGVDLNVIF